MARRPFNRDKFYKDHRIDFNKIWRYLGNNSISEEIFDLDLDDRLTDFNFNWHESMSPEPGYDIKVKIWLNDFKLIRHFKPDIFNRYTYRQYRNDSGNKKPEIVRSILDGILYVDQSTRKRRTRVELLYQLSWLQDNGIITQNPSFSLAYCLNWELKKEIESTQGEMVQEIVSNEHPKIPLTISQKKIVGFFIIIRDAGWLDEGINRANLSFAIAKNFSSKQTDNLNPEKIGRLLERGGLKHRSEFKEVRQKWTDFEKSLDALIPLIKV